MRMRDLAARGDEKLLRTESSSPNRFRVWANRSYPEGIRLLLCISTVRATLAVRRKPDPPGKAVERRTKWAHAPGRTRGQGKSREKLPSAGDVKNDTAGLWAKGNLRVKRRDPWPRANAPPKAVADLELSGEDAKIRSHRRVFTWFASRWRNHQLKRAEKPHSKFSGRKALDGPATRPKTPLAVENGVGKLAAPARGRLMPARERESGELPSPICPCSTERSGRDLLFLDWKRPTSNAEQPTSN